MDTLTSPSQIPVAAATRATSAPGFKSRGRVDGSAAAMRAMPNERSSGFAKVCGWSGRGACVSEFQRATRRPATERSEGALLGAPPERAYSRRRFPFRSTGLRCKKSQRNSPLTREAQCGAELSAAVPDFAQRELDLSAFAPGLLGVAEDRIARLMNHVSELVIKRERVDGSHEPAVACTRDRHCFVTDATRQISRCRKSEKSLYLRAISR